MMAAALLVLLLGAAAGDGGGAQGAPPPSSSTRGCTKMDCEDRLTISVRAADGQRSQSLVIELDVDGKTVTCAAAAGAAAEPRTCSPEVTVAQQEIQRCRPAGCEGTGRFEDFITIAATPKRVRLRLKQGERKVAERLFVSSYARVRPNGPGCPPVCRQAQKIWQYRAPATGR